MVSGEHVGDVLVEYYVNRWGVVFVRRLFSASGVTVYVRNGREVEYLRGLSGRRLQTAVKQHADDWPQGLTEVDFRLVYDGVVHQVRKVYVLRLRGSIRMDIRWEACLELGGVRE